MRTYKKLNTILLVILCTSMFGSVFGLIVANANQSEITIIESFTPRLGDNRTAFVKFSNSTGLYLTEKGITTELESYVEEQWKIDYREAYQKYQKNLEKQREHENRMNTLQKVTDIICSPLTILFSIINPISIPIITLSLPTVATQMLQSPTTSDIIAGSGAVIEDTLVEPNINDFQPMFGINEDNDTHYWVGDPSTANTTDGFWFPLSETYVEVSRGNYGQHFYNRTEGTYTFKNTDMFYTDNQWLSIDEYPNRFILRLVNGSLYFRYTPEEMNTLISQIDNSTIWAVGYESYAGVMAFYLNFADTDWGHGQYIWYPRLRDGTIPSYNQPLYAFYPHLFANYQGTWYDKILNDRSLYDSPEKNPRNTLHFFNTSDTIGLYFDTYNITVLNSNWDFTHGFKYNFTEFEFHMINEFRCNDRDFDNIGFGYEITQSPQADGTEYEIDQIRVSDGEKELTFNITDAIQVDTYLDDFYSSVDFISVLNSQEYQDPVIGWNETSTHSNETHSWEETVVNEPVAGHWRNDTYVYTFSFEDMELAGFTSKYLEIHDQQFPDGSNRNVLLAGMYDYGSYTNGTWVFVDPSGSGDADDNEDLYRTTSLMGNTYYAGSTSLYAGTDGDTGSPEYYGINYECFIAIDTGIVENMGTVTVTTFRVWGISDSFDSGEGARVHVYNIGGNGGSSTAKENSQSYSLGTSTSQIWYYDEFSTGGYTTMPSAKGIALANHWGSNRGDTENWISFRFFNYGGDFNANDYFQMQDSQYGTSRDADISITFDEGNADPTADAYISGVDLNQYASKPYSWATSHTDTDGYGTIAYAYAGLGTDANSLPLFSFRCDPNSGTSGTATVMTGSDYVYSVVDWARPAPSGNTFTITWTYRLKFTLVDATYDDKSNLDYFAYTIDDSSDDSGWIKQAYNMNYENDLVIYSVAFQTSTGAHPNGLLDGVSTSDIPDGFFQGGMNVRASGYIAFQTAPTTYPDITAVDIGLNINGADLGDSYDDDTLGASGEFVTPYFTTSSSVGTDLNYDFSLQILDWHSDYGGTSANFDSGSSTDYTRDMSRDNTNPTITVTSGVTTESSSYLYYDGTPVDGGYYSDNMGSSGTSFYVGGTVYDETGVELSSSGVVDNEATWGDNPSDEGTVLDSFTESASKWWNVDNEKLGTTLNPLGGIYDGYTINTVSSVLGNYYLNPTTDKIEYEAYQYSLDTDGSFLYPTDLTHTDIMIEADITVADSDAGWTGFLVRAGATTAYFIGFYGLNQYIYVARVDIISSAFTIAGLEWWGTTVLEDTSYNVKVIVTGTNPVNFYIQKGSESWLYTESTYLYTGTSLGLFASGDFPSADTDTAIFDDFYYGGLWGFDYQVDNGDTGNKQITFTATDGVGNTGTETFDFTEDNTAPTVGSLNVALTPDVDSDGGNDINPNSGWYDDNSVDVTITGTATESGVGLPTLLYSYKYSGGSYGSWVSGGTTVGSVPQSDSQSIIVRVRDNLDNIGDALDSVVVKTDYQNAAGYFISLVEVNNFNYLFYESPNKMFFNGIIDNLVFNVEFSDSTDTNFWKVIFPAAYGESEEEVGGSPPYTRTNPYVIESSDTTDDFLCRVFNQAGNAQATTVYAFEDITAPVIDNLNLVLTADGATIGYVPNTGYYDDDSIDVTVSGSADDGLGNVAGVNSTYPYGYKYDGGSYGSWLSGGSTIAGVTDGSRTIYIRVKDNVDNIATDLDSVGVIVDIDSPTGYSLTHTSGLDGWASSESAYYSSGTIYFKNDRGSGYHFVIDTNDDGTIQNSLYWHVEWDTNGIFETVEEDTDPLATATKDFYYWTDTGGTDFLVRVVNNAGNYQTFTYSTDDDQTLPTNSIYSLVEEPASDYLYITGNDVYFSDEMGSSDVFFNITLTVADSGGAGLYGLWMLDWDDDAAEFDFTAPYSRIYSTDDSETTDTLLLYAVDWVGNWASPTVSLDMIEDLAAPTSYALSLDADSDGDGGDDINPQSGYYDDNTVDVTSTGSPSDGAGSGLPTNLYTFKWDGGSYNAFQSSSSWTSEATTDGSLTLYV